MLHTMLATVQHELHIVRRKYARNLTHKHAVSGNMHKSAFLQYHKTCSE